MNYRNLKNFSQRQFNKTLELQGQEVTIVNKDATEKVFFELTNNTNSTQDKIMIYHSADGNIMQGDTIKLKDNCYLVLNEGAYESEVYRKSVCYKCNQHWRLGQNEFDVIVSDIANAGLKNGSFASLMGGSLTVMLSATENSYTQFGVDMMFYFAGGAWKVTNKFYLNGICTIMFERTTLNQTGDEHFIIDSSIDFSQNLQTHNTYNIIWSASGVGNTSDAKAYFPLIKFYDFAIDDESVATISEDGNVLNTIGEGTCTLTFKAESEFMNGGATSPTLVEEKSITITVKGEEATAYYSITKEETEVPTTSTTSSGTYDDEFPADERYVADLRYAVYDGDNNTLSIDPTLTLRMYTSDGELVEDSEQMITCGFVNYDTWGQVCVWFTPENKSYACSTYGWGTTSSSNVFWGTMLKGYKVEVDIHWDVDSGLDYTWKFTFK